MTEPNNVDIIRDWYVTLDPAVLHEDAELRMAPTFPNKGIYRGPKGMFEEWWPKHAAIFSAWQAVPDEILDAGDAITVLGRYVGRAAASGRSFEVPFAHIWRMRDGRIASLDQYCDTHLLRQALGEESLAYA